MGNTTKGCPDIQTLLFPPEICKKSPCPYFLYVKYIWGVGIKIAIITMRKCPLILTFVQPLNIVVLSHSQFHFLQFQSSVVKCDLKILNKNVRNKQFISFELCTVLSSVTKFPVILIHPVQGVCPVHPHGIYSPPVGYFIAILPNCHNVVVLILLNSNSPKVQE